VSDAERPLSLHTAVERPDLRERGIPSDWVWPEYNLHGDVVSGADLGDYWEPNVWMVHPELPPAA
jgi:hypothetical protein